MYSYPGTKGGIPATPYDAKGLMQAALNGTDPVIFLEAREYMMLASNSMRWCSGRRMR